MVENSLGIKLALWVPFPRKYYYYIIVFILVKHYYGFDYQRNETFLSLGINQYLISSFLLLFEIWSHWLFFFCEKKNLDLRLPLLYYLPKLYLYN